VQLLAKGDYTSFTLGRCASNFFVAGQVLGDKSNSATRQNQVLQVAANLKSDLDWEMFRFWRATFLLHKVRAADLYSARSNVTFPHPSLFYDDSGIAAAGLNPH
jgi:hypothetical protein